MKEEWFTVAEYQRRLASVRAEMALRELEALVIFSPANIYYLTGHHSVDSWEYRAAIICHDRDPVLLLYNFERGRFLTSSWLEDAIFYGPMDDPVQSLAVALKEQVADRSAVGIEVSAPNLNVVTYQRIEEKLGSVRLVATDRLVDRIRMVKSEEELSCIRHAAEMTKIGLRQGISSVREGVSDSELIATISAAMFRAGSHQFVMQPTVAIGYRSGLAHSQHNSVQAKRGDSVFLEFGGCWRHYSAPIMYTTTIGAVSDERNELSKVAHETAEVIIANARPGVRACDVASKAKQAMHAIEDRVQFHYIFGYSVGVSFPPHWLEDSNFHIRASNQEVLQAGMVFHLPLTMRVLGKYGTGTSRTIEITQDGAEALTGDPAWLETPATSTND